MEGWISLYRKFINWQWYKDSNVKAVFIHLLLSANHKQEKWNNTIIERGQVVTSRQNLSKVTGLSIQQIRTCLSKLESTNEIKIEPTNRYSLITILKYNKYQKNINEQSTSKITEETTCISTSQKDMETTNKKQAVNIENSGFQNQIKEKPSNPNMQQPTSKTTCNSTDKVTTNNNIYNNTNNINNIKLNKTKLNLLFNYLINKEKSFENLTEMDKTAIISTLKRLEMYTTNIECLPENIQFQLKIEYWTITEIYTSPYKIYLNQLTRNTFMLKYLQTEKYIGLENEDKIGEFISYLITCLRKEFEKM